MFWKAILLFLGLYISFLIRNVSADFQESTWIFASAMVVLVGSLVILPLAYLVQMAAAPFYVFLASSFLVCTALVMGFMLIPKLFRLNEVGQPSDASKRTSALDRRGSGAARVHSNHNDNSSTHAGSSVATTQQVRSKYIVLPTSSQGAM